MPGILSGTWYFKKMKEQLNLVNNGPNPQNAVAYFPSKALTPAS
jgi:hypothetical protein